MQRFNLPRAMPRDRQIARIGQFLAGLSMERGWEVVVSEVKRKRSDAQNRFVWGVCYPAILQHLQGWDANDLHEYCLGEWSGWEIIEGLGRKRMKPIRRSSKLSVTEFMDYVAWMQRHFAEHGICIPDPNEEIDGGK